MDSMVDNRKALLTLIILLSVLIAGSIMIFGIPDRPSITRPELYDDFDTGAFNPDKWAITKEGDTGEWIVDVIDRNPEEDDYRLRMGMDTIGTRDDTVKYLGVRSVKSVDLNNERRISFDVDWNNQSNGCYLTASFILCPTITDGNPENENEWVKFEYVGVPPGKNARAVISSKSDGSINYLFMEDWPSQKTGREIGNQRIEIILNDGVIQVSENGTELYQSKDSAIEFTSAHVYLQMSSHSNYPFRDIYFDNLIAA